MSASHTKSCPNCRARIDASAETCPKCGFKIEKKDARIAAVASLVLPGLGQLYNRQMGKGIVFVILGIVLLSLITSSYTRSDFRFGLILYPVFLIYNVYDAYSKAKEINEGAY